MSTNERATTAIVPSGDNEPAAPLCAPMSAPNEQLHYVEIFLVSEIEWTGECRCGRSITSTSSRRVEEFFDQSCAIYPQKRPPSGSDRSKP